MAELKPPKNRKKGTVTRLSKDELENFLVESYRSGGRSYVFKSNQHRKYSTLRIEQIVKKIGEEAGIGITITPHLLRHTRATLLAEAGMSKDHLQVLVMKVRILRKSIPIQLP